MAKRKTKPLKARLHAKAWDLFSIFIRQRGADWRGVNSCFTCGVKKPWKELHAGHRYHGKLDFDEVNIHPQCVKCNHFDSGNLGFYERNLVKTYGQKVADDLAARAAQFKGYSIEEIKDTIQKYGKSVPKTNRA